MLNSDKAGRATEFVPANDCSRNACFPSRDICTLTPGQLAEPTTILSSEKSEHQETQKFNTFKVRKRHKVCCFKQDAYAYQLVCKLSCEWNVKRHVTPFWRDTCSHPFQIFSLLVVGFFMECFQVPRAVLKTLLTSCAESDTLFWGSCSLQKLLWDTTIIIADGPGLVAFIAEHVAFLTQPTFFSLIRNNT